MLLLSVIIDHGLELLEDLLAQLCILPPQLFLGVFMASALLDAAYFFPIVYAAFFRPPKFVKDRIDEASPLVIVPIVITALGSLILGLFPNLLLNFLRLAGLATKTILGG